MAGLKLEVSSDSRALTASTLETVLQIAAPTNQRVKVTGFDVSFDGVSNTAVPTLFRLLRQTTAGTFTNNTNVPKLTEKEMSETPQTNFQTVATAEPTAGDVIIKRTIPAFMGSLDVTYPFDRPLWIQGGGRLGWEFTATANVNVCVNVRIEE